jgi:signal transduction histidine kinase
MAQGLDTLDLAQIHADGLTDLMPANCTAAVRDKAVKLAGTLFLDVIAPIEKTHRGIVENNRLLKASNAALRQRTVQLRSANRSLKAQIARRKSAERSLQLSEKTHRVLLKEACQMQVRLRHLSHQVLSAQEEERKAISRELHDEIVQTLTAINVQLAALKIEAGPFNQGFTKQIAYTQSLVEKSMDIVHRRARDLRPTVLDDLGLIPALHAYMKGFTARTGLRIDFSTFAGVERLSSDKRTVLYRVAQAALVNIGQHAKATSVSVAIKELPKGALMVITDNGISFDADQALDSRGSKSLGLIGMRERVEMVGGKFDIESAPDRGTSISSMLPFKRR